MLPYVETPSPLAKGESCAGWVSVFVFVLVFVSVAGCLPAGAQGFSTVATPLSPPPAVADAGRYPGLHGWVVSVTESSVAPGGTQAEGGDSTVTTYWLDAHGSIVAADRCLLTAEGALLRDALVFRYDHRLRLAAILAVALPDPAQPDTLALYRYDDADRLLAILYPGSDRPSRVQYEYSGAGVCQTFYDRWGRAMVQTCFAGQPASDARLQTLIDYDPHSGDARQGLTVTQRDGAGRPLLLADMLLPDDVSLQTTYDYDPFGNLALVASEGDTVAYEYTRYDLQHNWLCAEQVDNGLRTSRVRRTIRYARDSADFADVQRLHDPLWNEDNPSGFFEIHYPGGDYYIGHLLQGQRHGTGDLRLAGGTSYTGSFFHGRYHGAGVLRTDAEIHAVWSHGHILTDHVEIHYPDSARYTGEFHPEGDSCRYRGATRYRDGSSYEGEYAVERYDGEGTLKKADGTVMEGWWMHGKPHGTMLIVMPNYDRHYARFELGRRVGVSTIEYINGDLYCGETDQNGLPHGMGTYTTAAGKSRTGYFLEGKYKSKNRPPQKKTKN